jgi:hypothetical protein
MSNSFLLYPVRVATHYFVAVAGGMTIGLILESTVGRLYSHTAAEPFVPCVAIPAFVLGLLVSDRVDRVRLASWTWTVGFDLAARCNSRTHSLLGSSLGAHQNSMGVRQVAAVPSPHLRQLQ